jgi:hypothetical protein
MADALARQQGIDAESSKRQAMLDALALEDRGFTEAGVRQERTKAAAPAISAMLNTAMSMGRGAAPTGVLPDMSALDRATGMYGTSPAQSFTVAGKTYEKMQTKQQEAAMEASRTEEAQNRAKRLDASLRAPTPLEEKRMMADITASNAQADASRAAAALSRAGGRQRTPEDIRDNIANAIAKYATARDPDTGKLPDMEQIKVFSSTLKAEVGASGPLEDEFTSAADKTFITNARKNGYSDAQIRQQLSKK